MPINMIFGYIFLALFVVLSLFHLVMCYLEREKERKISKVFLLLFLGIMAICFAKDKPLIYCGAFAGMLGDWFLINKRKKVNFATGMILFLIGHILYATQAILLANSSLHYGAYIGFAVAMILFPIILIPVSKKVCPGPLGIVGTGYFVVLLSMLALGIYLGVYLNNPLVGSLFGLGYLMFFSSDCILTSTTFVKDIRRRDFYIMATYLLGQVLIVFALLCASGVIWH